MFISNINEDIKIEFNAVETGWKIKGSKVKVCGNIMFQLTETTSSENHRT